MIFSAQITAARGLIGISQAELAAKSKVSLSAIQKYEQDDEAISKAPVQLITQIKETLEKLGIEFLFTKNGSKIVRVGVDIKLKS